jgi:hypothetical protein
MWHSTGLDGKKIKFEEGLDLAHLPFQPRIPSKLLGVWGKVISKPNKELKKSFHFSCHFLIKNLICSNIHVI